MLRTGRNTIGNFRTRRSGAEVCVLTSLVGKEGNNVSHVNAHRRVNSVEDCNNPVERRSCALDTSQPVSPVSPEVAHRACEQSGHGDRDGNYDWAQQHRLQLTEDSLAIATNAKSPVCLHSQGCAACFLAAG